VPVQRGSKVHVILIHVTAQTDTAQASQHAPLRGGAYQRISHDKAGDEHGVANQLADQKRAAAARGIVITRVESDNDISASNGKHRPGYQAIMAAAARRELDVILVFQTSRFWRNRRERAEGIEILRNAGVSLIATKGPSLDMSSAYGRMMAGLLGEFDTAESEVKGERQKLANEEAAMAGKRFTGGPRPFGYEPDHVTVRPAEAAAIRWAADALLGGSTVSAVTREWNRRGLVSAQGGRPFTRQSVTSILRNPRIAGLAVLPQREDPDDRPELDSPPRRRKRLLPPEITGAGQWEAIITEEQWRALTALLGDPARKPPRGAYTLLGGLAVCRCGNKVAAGTNATGRQVYRCDPATRGDRPGPHCQQMTANVDPEVEKVIVERLSRDDLADLISPPSAAVDTAALHREAAAIRRNLDEMAADRALGLMSRTQMIAATERGNARLAEITADLAASASGSALAPFAAGRAAAEVWAGLDVARRRAVIGALAAVTIHPAGRGARTFDPDTVTFDPHQTPAL
jgi:site-specific DNA recombinase